MAINYNASGTVNETFTPDKLIAGGPVQTRSMTIESKAGVTGSKYQRGALMNIDFDGKLHLLSHTATAVAIAAGAEVVANNRQAASGTAPVPFVTANPGIPGSVNVVSTADSSAVVVKQFGTDNGEGVGVGADGWFTYDYETGQGVAYPTAAFTDGNDLKVAYTHRSPDAADSGETQSAMPKVILAEDVTDAAVIAGDVVVTVYIAGQFNSAAIPNYSAGYRAHLRRLNIDVRSAYTY